MRRSWLIDCLAIFLLTSILIWPLFKTIYLDRWGSIESTFIADGRMQLANLPHRNWQPLWYCGTRADYVYPPALRYGTAIIAKVLSTSPAHAYHIYIAFFYALGIVGIYILVRVGNGSRGFAWLAAAAAAILSPNFLLTSRFRVDSLYRAPQRLHVLIDWGEGPHISALSVLPLVFAAAILAVRRNNPAWLGAAAVAAAIVVTNNFYGLTALAILFPILAWVSFAVQPNRRVLLSFGAIAALAYGLTAWWLVPSYLRVTSRNLKLVAEPGNLWSFVILIVLLAAYLAITFKLAPAVKSTYPLFVWSGFLFLSLYVLGRMFSHFQVAGDAIRLVPEFDLFFILAAVELLRWLWNRPAGKLPAWLLRAAVALVIITAFWSGIRYVKRSHRLFPQDYAWSERVEYRTANWMHQNAPGQRALATGSIRFWYDVWHDLPQMDGGSQQGLLNPNIVTAQYRILRGNDMKLTRLWLTALAVDIAIIPEKMSKEFYHDLSEEIAAMWRKEFPILRDDGEGNIFYRIERRSSGIARIVGTKGISNLPAIPAEGEQSALEAYVAAIEAELPAGDANGRLRMTRPNTDAINIDVTLSQGESVLVQENYDSAWRAYSDGRLVNIERDPIGFMVVHLPSGNHSLAILFEPTLESYIGRILSCISLIIVLMLVVAGYRRSSVQLGASIR